MSKSTLPLALITIGYILFTVPQANSINDTKTEKIGNEISSKAWKGT